MNWNAPEPEPGVCDDEYVEGQRRLIRLAHRHQIRVFLDMHQDLYSTLFGNGAPAWATFTDGELYEPGQVWSDAYLFNKAVQKAFDHYLAEYAGFRRNRASGSFCPGVGASGAEAAYGAECYRLRSH
ncbi:hypothetical protein FLT15_25280 [Paenibacillus thiaminolyticus]|nr:hypothetical protein [Paenibacillus thiaminolyticus]